MKENLSPQRWKLRCDSFATEHANEQWIHHGREDHKWLVANITWQFAKSLHQNSANGNCPWLGEACNSNKYIFNIQNGQSVFLASLPSLALCFQPHSRPFVWLLRVLEYAKIRTVLQSNTTSTPGFELGQHRRWETGDLTSPRHSALVIIRPRNKQMNCNQEKGDVKCFSSQDLWK